MEYIYAALLLHKAGKEISEATVTAVLQAAGIEVNDARAKALIAALEGVDIEEAMATAAVVAAPSPRKRTRKRQKRAEWPVSVHSSGK
jgi:large subunit ribosomal protein L12